MSFPSFVIKHNFKDKNINEDKDHSKTVAHNQMSQMYLFKKKIPKT